ncbi:MAG: response regulator [Blastocatellia bacterium]|nr:response regulator [Blastocatellia bacterium]
MGKKILVVDDDDAIRELFDGLLTEAGYEVALAEDGLAAVAYLKKEVPDLVILDVMMPVINGPRLMELIRSSDRPEMWQVPILICSAASVLEDVTHSKEFNVSIDDCISKPFEVKLLLKMIQKKLSDEPLPPPEDGIGDNA